MPLDIRFHALYQRGSLLVCQTCRVFALRPVIAVERDSDDHLIRRHTGHCVFDAAFHPVQRRNRPRRSRSPVQIVGHQKQTIHVFSERFVVESGADPSRFREVCVFGTNCRIQLIAPGMKGVRQAFDELGIERPVSEPDVLNIYDQATIPWLLLEDFENGFDHPALRRRTQERPASELCVKAVIPDQRYYGGGLVPSQYIQVLGLRCYLDSALCVHDFDDSRGHMRDNVLACCQRRIGRPVSRRYLIVGENALLLNLS